MKLFQGRMVFLMKKEKKMKKIRNFSQKHLMKEKVARLVLKIRMFNVIYVESRVISHNFIKNAKL